MGRPKRYATPAARQAAYRQRVAQEMVTVNRAALERWEARLARLLAAIAHAAHAGDPVAGQVHRTHETETLEYLIAWFLARGQG
jgi:phage baseplate assembly protein W